MSDDAQDLYLFMLGKHSKYNFNLLEQSDIKDLICRYMIDGSKLRIKYLEYKSKEAREIWGRTPAETLRSLKDVK